MAVAVLGCGAAPLPLLPAQAGGAPGAAPTPDEAAALIERFRTCTAPETPATCADGLVKAAALDEAAHRSARAIEARRIVFASTGVDKSVAAANAYQLGTDYRAIAEFQLAAAALERSAALDPGAATAGTALTDAIVLRLGLGDAAAAGTDAERFFARPGPIEPELGAKVAFVRGAWASEHGDPTGAERELAKSMALIDKGPTWLRLTAHAMLARALVAAHHDSGGKAAAEWTRVRELGATLKPPRDEGELRNYAKGLIAIGDAIVYAADQKRLAVTWAPVPPYKGGESAAEIDRFVAASVTPWVSARKATIEDLEPAYRAVLELVPVPPPGGVVIAAARVAAMWADAADALATAPHPKAWDAAGPKAAATRKLFADRIAAATGPFSAKAKAANVFCVGLSVKYQYVAPEATACGEWLTKRWPHEYPRLDELQIAPTYRSSSEVPGILLR